MLELENLINIIIQVSLVEIINKINEYMHWGLTETVENFSNVGSWYDFLLY